MRLNQYEKTSWEEQKYHEDMTNTSHFPVYVAFITIVIATLGLSLIK